MSRYFTSDWHLGSSLINKYANRPFANASENAVKLVDNCNAIARDCSDVVFHVGDFWLNNVDRHGGEEDVNMLTATCKDYIRFVDARLVLLAGNHDDGHNCEADLKSMVIDLNQNYRNVTVGHYPSTSQVIKKSWSGRTTFTKRSVNGYQGICGRPDKIHIHLCGHCHDKWLLRFDKENLVINVNVGVDVWNYKVVRDSEITELLDYFKATMWTKISPDSGVFTNFTLTRDELEKFKIAHSEEMKEIRAQRKQEKHAKKGLTPAECERRRIEAMKAKGLI